MAERKKTFLERLTGTVVINEKESFPSHEVDMKKEQEEIYHTNVGTPGNESESAEDDVESFDEEEVAGLAIDMYETDNELIIQSMIAGVAPENLHIAITRDLVTITGKRIAPGVPEHDYITQELYWGVFSRAIALPFEIDTDGAEAVEKFGLLIIRLPKIDRNRAQELKVKTI
ncbi:MAG: hypothetical protein A2845_05550 [Candidatus Lloydbacteria bacterium RIFCSPHIGHO2_01_FULL_49_22]|uniref:SHSP domain-containing protein n=1 Tax=Candidatus Lloydbacteria bacterium RIFCSPHIGHO2_01_FULL_49_22 TaxID=1798658 RepID=A0A1G2CVX0_9BACT|nr:MAG: hypothetical protein A2845_05550 [Candidatus Lloydbacteria bacterium RIFCSPHIGHO2_01_FULL_49_22]OGZ09667.1 MAG: hypothetical protein A3C14_02860 [Candidatus Lloydbacteria bacterium RIFCSPHIGHO2_02_FULL_50_18]